MRAIVEVVVRNNDVEQAIKALKKKGMRAGTMKELRKRKHFEKPSEIRARRLNDAVRRQRKEDKKRRERDGF